MKNLILLIVSIFAFSVISCDVNSPVVNDIESFTCSDTQTTTVFAEIIDTNNDSFILNVIKSNIIFDENENIEVFIPPNTKIKPAFNTPFDYSLKCNNNKWFFN